MYYIGNDKRKKTSAILLLQALTVLSKKMDFEEVTISRLSRVSRISRSTFYRLFDQPEDILSYYSDLIIDQIISIQHEPLDYSTFLKLLAEKWYDNSDFLDLILWSKRIDILNKSFILKQQEIISFINKNTNSSIPSDYLFYVLTSSLLGILQAWESNGKIETSAELLQISKNIYRMFLVSH